MRVDTQAEVQEVSYLEMSDEELLKAGPPTLVPEKKDEVKKPAVDEKLEGELDDDKTDLEDENDDPDAGKKPDPKPKADDNDLDEELDDDADKGKKPGSEEQVDKDLKNTEAKDKKPGEKEDEKVDNKDVKKDAPAIDYEAEYKRLLAPFKANGREIKVESVDDAISLMQMGANYNKQMAALKPVRKLMKMLENNGLMSEEKISFLIDLSKKDSGAINKLVKEAGIDPMDLDADKASAYKQTSYAVDDREIELDTTLDEIKDSPTYTRTLDVVSNKWDRPSKQIVAQNPELLRVIDSHMASGIYDLISTEIEREKLFGRLKGLSDIEAYRQVGDTIQARGGFDHLNQPKGTQTATKPKQGEVVAPKPKQAEDDGLKDKRRAASPTRPAAPSAAAAEFNPLSMSDDEFSKLATPKFK